jgi:ABC-type nitrate/sulfonate/bicarbonate transport system substrate-binding protein/CheY-like chemotaxis protein
MPEQLEIWGVNDPNISAQLALAHKLGLFKKEAGLDVSCKFIESGTTMADDVLKAKKKPFAFTQTPITALLLHEKGFSTKLVAPLADVAGTQQVIINESSGIFYPKDLEGKRLGMAQGAAVYIAVENMAHDFDVNLKAIHFIDLLPLDQLAAFESGKLDAIACWEPWTTKAQELGGRFYFSGTRSAIPGMEGDINWLINQSCLIVPDEHFKNQSELVVAILNVLWRATNLINRHREKVLGALANFFGISRVELVIAMQKNTYSLSVTNLFRLGVLKFRDFLYNTGRISSKFTEEMLYDTTFLQQVDRSLVFLEDTVLQDVKIVEENGIYYRKDFEIHSNGSPLRFLLADDSLYVRALLTRIVKNIGGEIVGEATNGGEIIEKFALLELDVITVDLSMPGVSGIEAIKILTQIGPEINIIVISSMNLQEVREELFHLGVKMFVTKPFDPGQVASLLKKHIIRT